MRLVAVLLLFTALASFQLPWVMCAEQNVHVGNHWAAEHEHDGGGQDHDPDHDHRPIDWSAIAHARTVTVLAAPALLFVAPCSMFPVAAESDAAPQAKGCAQPVEACPQTTVLLL